MDKNQDFMVGADPEFVGVNPDKSCVSAGNFLAALRQDRDASDIEGDKDESSVYAQGRFGSDGGPFEVRPDPDHNPLQVVENIATIFRRGVAGNADLFGLAWYAGSYQCQRALGGHIHIGTKQRIEAEGGTRLLDDYLGAILTLVEGKGGTLRRSTGYGAPGGYREQGHGFEYRTPGSWLVSPYVAAASLCLAKTVISEYLNNQRFEFHRHATWGPEPTTVGQITNRGGAIQRGKIKLLRDRFPAIWDDITRMALYREYQPYLDVLHFLVTNKLTWFPRVSMKSAWGVEQFSLPLPRSIPMNLIWSRYRQEACHHA